MPYVMMCVCVTRNETKNKIQFILQRIVFLFTNVLNIYIIIGPVKTEKKRRENGRMHREMGPSKGFLELIKNLDE